MLIRIAAPAEELRCRFALTDATLGVEVAVAAAAAAAPPDPSSSAWRVLTSLTDDATTRLADRTATIALTARREVTQPVPR